MRCVNYVKESIGQKLSRHGCLVEMSYRYIHYFRKYKFKNGQGFIMVIFVAMKTCGAIQIHAIVFANVCLSVRYTNHSSYAPSISAISDSGFEAPPFTRIAKCHRLSVNLVESCLLCNINNMEPVAAPTQVRNISIPKPATYTVPHRRPLSP